MSLRLLGTTGMPAAMLADLQARVQAAHDLAEKAEGTGQNARQMVLNRDDKLDTAATEAQQAAAGVTTLAQQQASLEQLAATLGAAIPASEQTHAAIGKRIDDLAALVAALQAKAIEKREKRVTTTTLLALGASVDLAVTWDQPFVDANYLAIPLLDASAGLANVSPPAIKSQTKTGCVVTVRANVAVAAGLAVNVVGLRFG